jgi:hypothetical protein
MRNRELHDSLRDFALDAAALLTSDVSAGAELGFDVDEEPGSGSILYRYRPRTAEYIAERWPRLAMLPSCEPAARSLGTGASGWLRVRGVDGAEAEPALRAMLERLYEDATSFDFPEERFERVYIEVERTLYEHTLRSEVVAPLAGMWLEVERVELADGLSLARGDLLDAPAEAVWPERERDGEPSVLCVLARDQHADLPLPIAEARLRFRRLLGGLRLFKAGALALGPLAWSRAGDGAWRSVPLGPTGQLRGDWWTLSEAEAAELPAFLELVEASTHSGVVGWALSRFEMGLERAMDAEALTDHLLALRALLDATDDAGRASLSLRLAALCAEEGERRAVQRRVEMAFALERFLIGGGSGEAYAEAIGSESPQALAFEIEAYLRAILRDVVCGYLDADLKSAADDMLLTSGDPVHIRARDLRDQPEPEPEPQPEPEREPEPEPEPVPEPEPESAAEVAAHDVSPTWRPPEVSEDDSDPGVTPSADWDLDEDPASYSAPV